MRFRLSLECAKSAVRLHSAMEEITRRQSPTIGAQVRQGRPSLLALGLSRAREELGEVDTKRSLLAYAKRATREYCARIA